MIPDKDDVLKGKEPAVFGAASAVHNSVDISFNSSPDAFSEVLVLVVWFTLPVRDGVRPEDVADLDRGFDRSAVRDELVRSTTFADVVLKARWDLFLVFHAVDVTDFGKLAYKELCHGGAIIYGRNVGVDGIVSKRFIATWCVDLWVVGPVPFP